MKSRRIVVFLAFALTLAAVAQAKEGGALTVWVNNWAPEVAYGEPFTIHAGLNYNTVPRDRVVIVRIKSADEPQNVSLNDSKVQNACKDMSQSACSGYLEGRFDAHFNKEVYGERLVTVDAIAQTMDGKTQHFLDQYILKIKVVRKPTLTIDKIDAPRPPDTVRVNEPVPVRVTFKTSWLVQDSKVRVTIEATSGGSGQWTWESGRLAGGVIKTTDPIQVKLDKAGRWGFRVKVETSLAEAQAKTFAMEAVQEAKRQVGPVTLAYPKPPETVRVGEDVRFDVTMQYRNMPAGTVASLHFADHATGQGMIDGFQWSQPFSGDGTYRFGRSILHPLKPGDWKVDLFIELPKLNDPNDLKTFWQDTVTLKVVGKPAADAPGGSDAMQATITKIDRPKGTLTLDEVAPIVVHIRYDKLGALPLKLTATVTNATGGGGQSVTSLPLAKNGTYTFPNALIKAAPLGKIEIKVEVKAPDGRVLNKKKFYMKVVR